jgi:putative toxin-antitoxin system antitoxin component (TIGR02293 family)
MSASSYATFTPPNAVYEATLPGTTLLKLKARNLHQLEEELTKGLNMKALTTLSEKAGTDLKTLASLLGMGYSTLTTLKRTRGRLTPEQSARAYRVARILERAIEVIGSEADVQGWLRDPVLALGKRTPLETMGSAIGSERVLHLLERLDDGVYS